MISAPDTSPFEADEPAVANAVPAPGEPGAVSQPAADAALPDATGPAGPPTEAGADGSPGSPATGPTAHRPPQNAAPVGDCGPLLKKTFPALFAGGPKPLKLRIQVDIQERAPGLFSKQALSAFFRRYTGSTSYLVAVSRAKHRFDLDGAPAGELTDEHRKIALDELARRRGNTESRAALEEQQRRNRATLLHDFERTTLTPANFCALKGIAVDELEGYLATARREAAERPPNPRAFDRPAGPGPAPGPRGDGRPGPGHRAGERAGQPQRGDGRPGQPHRADGRPGQPPHGGAGRPGQLPRGDMGPGQPPPGDGRPGQQPRADGRPGQPTRGHGRPGRPPRHDSRPALPPGAEGREGQPSGAATDPGPGELADSQPGTRPADGGGPAPHGD